MEGLRNNARWHFRWVGTFSRSAGFALQILMFRAADLGFWRGRTTLSRPHTGRGSGWCDLPTLPGAVAALVALPFLAVSVVGAQMRLSGPAPPNALSAVVLDALECLDEQERLQRGRDEILESADSLGFEVELLGPSERAPLLREIEVVKNRYADLGLDLLLRQEVCRTLATDAVAECNRVVARLHTEARAGGRSPDRGAELTRWLDARERLEGALTASAVYEYPVLPSQENETVETTRLKLQYYEEVNGLLLALDERLEVRLDSVRESAEALRDAWQFLEDLSFADMGDPNPGGDALAQIQSPGESDPFARPESRIAMDRTSAGIDFALSGSPTGPEQAEVWIRVLEERRDSVQRMLGVMGEQLRLHRARLAASAP